MRVLYDGQIYTTQAAGGINRYFANLIGHLPDTVTPTLTLRDRRDLHTPQNPRLRTVQRRIRFWPGRVARRLERDYYKFWSDGRRYDVLHPTYYHLLTERPMSASRCPTVVTVYDMIHEIYGARVEPKAAWVVEQKKQAVQAAQAILCISECTKRDLLHFYPELEPKVTVTYLATELTAAMTDGPEPVPPQPYFLYVGARGHYKNFHGLIEAFARAAQTRPTMRLCVVGPPFTEDEGGRLAQRGIADKVLHYGQASDTHLAKLYRHSLAFVYPSLYEGFGIPPLEAMVCGTVVIAANRSSIPEVVGDAGLLFDPDAPDALPDYLAAVFAGLPDRNLLLAKGAARASQFGWARTAAETVQVYQSVAH